MGSENDMLKMGLFDSKVSGLITPSYTEKSIAGRYEEIVNSVNKDLPEFQEILNHVRAWDAESRRMAAFVDPDFIISFGAKHLMVSLSGRGVFGLVNIIFQRGLHTPLYIEYVKYPDTYFGDTHSLTGITSLNVVNDNITISTKANRNVIQVEGRVNDDFFGFYRTDLDD